MNSMGSTDKLQEMCAGLGVSPAVSSCLRARGLETPSDLAFSVPDPESLELLIKLVLRDDEAPEGNALQTPGMADDVLRIT